jgi:hypothetical protein
MNAKEQEIFYLGATRTRKERERQRATVPAVPTIIERQRKFPCSEEDRQE